MADRELTDTMRAARAAGESGEGEPAMLGVERREAVAYLTLQRAPLHNAFNAALIRELTTTLAALDADPQVRVVVLRGDGASFCAGADLAWMREMAGYGPAQNLEDARALAKLLSTLATLAKPTIARVHGPAYGGGVGLVACCDIAIAGEAATFALSEARLGLIPATISPYVIEAIGARQARRYFLSGERFTAAEALRLGLVHEIAPADRLDARIERMVQSLLAAGPCAQAACKTLIRAVGAHPIDAALIEMTAERIAATRASAEAKEGIAAFLDKRPPAWVARAKPEP